MAPDNSKKAAPENFKQGAPGRESIDEKNEAATADESICEKNEEVIDDDGSDEDDDYASLQRIISAKRRETRLQPTRIQEVLQPFPFAPLIRPLTISDLQSAIALENAAFTDPQHRASAEKVSENPWREGGSLALIFV